MRMDSLQNNRFPSTTHDDVFLTKLPLSDPSNETSHFWKDQSIDSLHKVKNISKSINHQSSLLMKKSRESDQHMRDLLNELRKPLPDPKESASDDKWIQEYSKNMSDLFDEKRHTGNMFFGHKNETDGWIMMQRVYNCCGVDSYNDWANTSLHPNVPDSCCISVHQGCGSNVLADKFKIKNIQKRGCITFLKNHFNQYVELETLDFQLFSFAFFIGLIFLSIALFMCARSGRSYPIVQIVENHIDEEADTHNVEDEGNIDEIEDNLQLLEVERSEIDNESDIDLDWLENSDEDV